MCLAGRRGRPQQRGHSQPDVYVPASGDVDAQTEEGRSACDTNGEDGLVTPFVCFVLVSNVCLRKTY